MELTSLDNARVKRVVKLRKHRHRRATGLFVAEGLREVERALSAGLCASELFVCNAIADAHTTRTCDGLNIGLADRFVVTEPVFRKMAYRENPEGVLAVFEQPQWTLAQLASCATPQGSADLWLVAVGLAKPGNLGAIARTAAAAGASGVLIADAEADAFNPNAIRASTGAVFSLPIVAETTANILAFLRERNINVLSAVVNATLPYTDADMALPTALVIGPEDTGLDGSWATASDATKAGPRIKTITIPMSCTDVDSLNASVTAGILLFEAARQRRM